MTAEPCMLQAKRHFSTFQTYRVWLVYELFRGSITDKQLEWSEGQIREFVANRKTANKYLGAAVGI
jgi:hypothetical protein